MDLAMCQRAHCVFLAAEDSCGSSVREPLMTGNLDDTPLRRNVSLEDDQASIWLDWVRELAHHILPRYLNRCAGFSTESTPARSHLLSIDQASSDEPLHQQRHSSGTIQVDRYISPARLQVGQQRRALADRIEIVDGKGN